MTVTRHRLSLKERRVQGLKSDLSHLKLEGEEFAARVTQQVIAATLNRTIESASTLVLDIYDNDCSFLGSPLMIEKFDLELDDLWFRLVAVDRAPPVTTITLEDRAVSYMRRDTKPRKALRSKMTRAEFILSMVEEVEEIDIPTHILELHKEQPIKAAKSGTADDTETDAAKKVKDEPADSGGFDSSADLTVKGVTATSTQIANATTVLSTAEGFDASTLIMEALIVTGIQENDMGTDGSGWFQVLPGSSAPSDLVGGTKYFIETGFTGTSAREAESQGKSPAEISSAVEGNQAGASDRYDDEPEAAKWVAAWGGGSGKTSTDSSGSKEVTKAYAFERKKGENTWSASLRLAQEVRWVRYMSAGVFYYASEESLYNSPVMMEVDEDLAGIESVEFNWDGGKQANEATISARVLDWAAPPGTVVRLAPKYGPARGRFIVSSIDKSLFSDVASITVKRPTPPLPEPAPETVTKSSGNSGGDASNSTASGGTGASAMVAWCESQVGKGTDANAGDLYGYGASASLPWCSIFIAAGLKAIGFSGSLPSNPAYSGAWIDWSGGSKVSSPEPGDLCIFDWGDGGLTDHVACFVGDGQVIGGNQSDAVTKVPMSSGSVVAYIRPKY